MSSVTEEDGMAKRASLAGDARTTDRYECSAPGHRVEHLRQAPSLDGRAEAQDRGRRHGAGCVGGDSSWQARHQHRAVLRLAATTIAARSVRRQDRHHSGFDGHRCGDERAAPGARYSCTARAECAYNGGHTCAARSTERPDWRDMARWCGNRTLGRGLRRCARSYDRS